MAKLEEDRGWLDREDRTIEGGGLLVNIIEAEGTGQLYACERVQDREGKREMDPKDGV
jgi:hypothetical protein